VTCSPTQRLPRWSRQKSSAHRDVHSDSTFAALVAAKAECAPRRVPQLNVCRAGRGKSRVRIARCRASATNALSGIRTVSGARASKRERGLAALLTSAARTAILPSINDWSHVRALARGRTAFRNRASDNPRLSVGPRAIGMAILGSIDDGSARWLVSFHLICCPARSTC
jgi:hypothetical protein